MAKAKTKSSGAANMQVEVTGVRAATAEELAELGDAPGIDVEDDDLIVATCRAGAFQLIPPHWENHANYRSVNNGLTLDFAPYHRCVVDEETASIIEQTLAGMYDNGFTDPKLLQKNALDEGLQLLRPGLVGPPMPTWDSVAGERVVALAQEAGFLPDLDSVKLALKYELQSPKRPNGRPARGVVVRDLERLVEDAEGIPVAADLDTSGAQL